MRNTLATTMVALSLLSPLGQIKATNGDNIANTFNFEQPEDKSINDPKLKEAFESIRIEDGVAYFDELGFGISLTPTLAKSPSEVELSTAHLDRVEKLIGLEAMIDLLNLTKRYLVIDDQGNTEFVRFSKIDGEYTGSIEEVNGVLYAAKQEYEKPVVQKRYYPFNQDTRITPNNPFYVLDVRPL